MANDHLLKIQGSELFIRRQIPMPETTTDLEWSRLLDQTLEYRNQLNMYEKDTNYYRNLKVLNDLVTDGVNSFGSTFFRTALAVPQGSSNIDAIALNAVSRFFDEIGTTILGKIWVAFPFLGSVTAQRIAEMIGTTTAVSNSASFGTAGYTGTGSTSLDTGSGANAVGSVLGGFGVYVSSSGLAGTAATVSFCGLNNATTGAYGIEFSANGSTVTGRYGSTISVGTTISNTNIVGKVIQVKRVATNDLQLWINGAIVGSTTTSVTNSAGTTTAHVGGRNNAGTVDQFASVNIGFYWQSLGTLTDAETGTLHGAVKNMMGRLGR